MATLIVLDHFSAVEHADALMKACKGWGTDEKAIISILGHRNAALRKKIRQAKATPGGKSPQVPRV